MGEIQRIFGELVLPFYGIKRDMYVPSENDRAENDAEHSWSLAFMTFMLAPKVDIKLDVHRAVTYAIIHDLIEIYAGDTSVWGDHEERSSKEKREQDAFEKIKSEFRGYPHLLDSLDAYRNKSVPEAKFVYALDKFHNWLTAYSGGDYYYKKLRKMTKAEVEEKLAEARPKAHTHPQIGKYYDELMKAFKKHPEFFYPDKLKV